MSVKLRNLTIKSPSGAVLLDNVNASIEAGVTALTGANGAGKSTLLKTIATIYKPAGGSITLNDVDNQTAKSQFLEQTIYMPQNFSAYPALSGLEFLCYFLRLGGQRKKQAVNIASAWLDTVELSDSMNAPTSTYSQGMLQRLGFAYIMQSDTALAIVDEPFAGVDPDSRAKLLALLFAPQCKDRTVILCTHHVDEVVNQGAKTLRLINKGLVS